jgi:phosphonoacetaldehyde hydrolase
LQLLNPETPRALSRVKRLNMIVLDWAGTTVDYGSIAPVKTLTELFARAGMPIIESEARRDMGLPKKDHIRNILLARNGNEDGLDELYRDFIPLQFACLADYSTVIPGVPEAVERFRQRDLKIGSTTGYTRAMLDILVEQSAQAGYRADCSLTPEDAGAGRPHPFMMYSLAIRLQTYPMAEVVKVGDTPVDILEGLNAGAWSVGVAKTGNMIGLSQQAFEALPLPEQAHRLQHARTQLAEAGAHYVVDSVAELDRVLDDINERLASHTS